MEEKSGGGGGANFPPPSNSAVLRSEHLEFQESGLQSDSVHGDSLAGQGISSMNKSKHT